jgi:hypothetical protein
MEIKSGFKGVSVSKDGCPIKLQLQGTIRSVQRCSSVNCPEYIAIELKVDDDHSLQDIEDEMIVAICEARDEVFLKTTRLKMSEEDVHDFFKPFKMTINLFPPREDKDKPIAFGMKQASMNFEEWKETIDELIDEETELTFGLECSRVWTGQMGSWGMGWNLVDCKSFCSS